MIQVIHNIAPSPLKRCLHGSSSAKRSKEGMMRENLEHMMGFAVFNNKQTDVSAQSVFFRVNKELEMNEAVKYPASNHSFSLVER